MRVPCRFIASEQIMASMDTQVFEQVTNVATLPGIIHHAYCMPDGHSGYGFPIGGVAAMDVNEGVISPGGIGFDINCLHPETKIMTIYGYYRQIKDLGLNIGEHVVSMDIGTKRKKPSNILLFL